MLLLLHPIQRHQPYLLCYHRSTSKNTFSQNICAAAVGLHRLGAGGLDHHPHRRALTKVEQGLERKKGRPFLAQLSGRRRLCRLRGCWSCPGRSIPMVAAEAVWADKPGLRRLADREPDGHGDLCRVHRAVSGAAVRADPTGADSVVAVGRRAHGGLHHLRHVDRADLCRAAVPTNTPAAGAVRDEVVAMAKSVGVPSDKIFVYDGSKQSNAYTANVSGLGGSAQVAMSEPMFKGADIAGARRRRSRDGPLRPPAQPVDHGRLLRAAGHCLLYRRPNLSVVRAGAERQGRDQIRRSGRPARAGGDHGRAGPDRRPDHQHFWSARSRATPTATAR